MRRQISFGQRTGILLGGYRDSALVKGHDAPPGFRGQITQFLHQFRVHISSKNKQIGGGRSF